MTDSPLPNRRHPLHGVWHEAETPTIVFLTVCTAERRPWLAQAQVHAILCGVWNTSTSWVVGRYVLMPDHLHLFCSPREESASLETWVKYWKSAATRSLRSQSDDSTAKLWQSNHWDTRLRRGDSYDEKWYYVRQNPVRAGLAKTVDDWPFQGEIFELRWE